MSVTIVLLAAGNSSRFGGPKLLATLDGVSLVRRAAVAALATGASLRVVTGAYAERVAAELAGLPARVVHNTAWQDGMGSSIGRAFRDLAGGPEVIQAAIVYPADLPRVGSAQLQRLLDAHAAAPHRILVSALGDAQGPPCLFPRGLFAELAELRGPHGARSVLARHASEVDRIPMPEAAIDIDTSEDHAREQASIARP